MLSILESPANHLTPSPGLRNVSSAWPSKQETDRSSVVVPVLYPQIQKFCAMSVNVNNINFR